MVLAGLPQGSKTDHQQQRVLRPWDEDFPTTVGKAAFAGLKEKARDIMVKGAEKRGLDWTGIVEALQVRFACCWSMVDTGGGGGAAAVSLTEQRCCCCVRLSILVLVHQGLTRCSWCIFYSILGGFLFFSYNKVVF